MNTKQKKALYESIMRSVAKQVKKSLNEMNADVSSIMDDTFGVRKETSREIKEKKATLASLFASAYNNKHEDTDGSFMTVLSSKEVQVETEDGMVFTYLLKTRNAGTRSASINFSITMNEVNSDYDGVVFIDRTTKDFYMIDMERLLEVLNKRTTKLMREKGVVKPITVRNIDEADFAIVMGFDIKMNSTEIFKNIK